MTIDIERLTSFPDHFVVQAPECKPWFRYFMIALGLVCVGLIGYYLILPPAFYPNADQLDTHFVNKAVLKGILFCLTAFGIIWFYFVWQGRKDVRELHFDTTSITATLRDKKTEVYKLGEIQGFSILGKRGHARNLIDPVSVADYSSFYGLALAPAHIYGFLLHLKDPRQPVIRLPLLDPLDFPRMAVWLKRHLPDLTPTPRTFNAGRFQISTQELRTGIAPLFIGFLFITAIIGTYVLTEDSRAFLCQLENLKISAQTDQILSDSCNQDYNFYSFLWDIFTQKQIPASK